MNRNTLARNRAVLAAVKASGCLCCGEMDEEVLDFHHVDPAEKSFNISGSRVSKTYERLMAEINKCIVVCSNDHRRIHAGTVTIERDDDEPDAQTYVCRRADGTRSFHGGR